MAKVSFNYKALDAKVSKHVQEHARLIHANLTRSGRTLVEIGKSLQATREIIGERLFTEWVRYEFNWGRTAVFKYLRVAMVFEGRQDIERIQPSAIIVLAQENIPETLIDEALEKARAGETVSYSWVKQRVAAFAVPRAVDAARFKTTVEKISSTIDKWRTALPKSVKELSVDELDELEDRIEALMQQIRDARAERVTTAPARRSRMAAAAD